LPDTLAGRYAQLALDGETLAALRTTGVQNRATAAGGHASAETVGALAANNGRLVGTFHDGSRLISKKSVKIRRLSGQYGVRQRLHQPKSTLDAENPELDSIFCISVNHLQGAVTRLISAERCLQAKYRASASSFIN
jgi:hypothetical protein